MGGGTRNESILQAGRVFVVLNTHLFIVIMYKMCICHSLEILFEPQRLLLGEGTKARSKEVNFQYKKRVRVWGVVLEMFLKFKVVLVFKKGIFNSVYFQPGRWILITLDSEVQKLVSLNHETRLRRNCERKPWRR